MRRPVGTRLLLSLTYVGVVLLATALLTGVANRTIAVASLSSERQEALTAVAGVSSAFADALGQTTADPARIAREQGLATNSRVLWLGTDGTVRVDGAEAPVLSGTAVTLPAALVDGEGARAAIYTADGRWTTWAVAPVTVGGRSAGNILLVRDLSSVQAALAQLRVRLWAVGALLALLLIPAGMLVARSLSAPLERLTAAVRRMETGELRQSVAASGSAETTALAGAFNDMTARVAALDEQRRAFVADAAHELRTPLAALQLLADNLVPDTDTEPEHLAAIRRQIARLGRLVDDLLTLARLDNPTLQMRREPLRVDNLLDEADWTVGPLAARRKIEIRRSSGGGEWVYGDPDWLHHSLVNVLDNALRHASDGGWVAVSISVAGAMVRIRIEDSGPGVPADVLPRLGTRFFRASAARDRSSGGSGLGLSIVREVMRLSGGMLSFSCEPGHGLCVDLALPEAPPESTPEMDCPGL